MFVVASSYKDVILKIIFLSRNPIYIRLIVKKKLRHSFSDDNMGVWAI